MTDRDDIDEAMQRNDFLDVLTRSLASCAEPIRADELLRNIEDCGYTFRLTTHEERLARNLRRGESS